MQVEPKIDLQQGRFFITTEEFEARVNGICFHFWKILAFAKFVVENFKRIKERHLAQGKLEMFVEFLSIFYIKNLLIPRACLENFVDSILLSFFYCMICAENSKKC